MSHQLPATPLPPSLRPESRVVGLGRGSRSVGEPLNVPLVPASNFRMDAGYDGVSPARIYSRDDGTPTWEALEQVMGDLEGGHALTFSSGMAAIAAILETLPAGAKVIRPRDCYIGVAGILADGAELGRFDVVTVQGTDREQIMAALPGAAMLWLETPSNPLLEILDIADLAEAAHAAGALVAVDSTFATPLLQNPLELGADFVVHSATKFIGGHSDLLLGVAITPTAEGKERLRRRREVSGSTPGTLEAYLAVRGIRTMALRLERAQANAGELARRLDAHPDVTLVRYPGLAHHAQHEIAARQMRGFGAVISFELADAATADAVCGAVRVIESATSLGGVESSMERREKAPGQAHIPPGLIRLSVGCEHIEDLWDDLSTAIAHATATRS